MSELYEGVVVVGPPGEVRAAFDALPSPLPLRLVRLPGNAFGVYRVADPVQPFAGTEVEGLAAQLSERLRDALAVFHDDRCGIRTSVLYSRGQRVREFGDADEEWVELGPDGQPLLTGPRFRASEREEDAEYDCVRSAIDAGLEALGADPGVTPAVLEEAFCYEEFGLEAERGPSPG